MIKRDSEEQIAKGKKSTLEVRSLWEWETCWPATGLQKDSKVKILQKG